jgi:hypothetical protein
MGDSQIYSSLLPFSFLKRKGTSTGQQAWQMLLKLQLDIIIQVPPRNGGEHFRELS